MKDWIRWAVLIAFAPLWVFVLGLMTLVALMDSGKERSGT